MRKLLELLKDGNSRTIEQMACELHTTSADIDRQLGYLEHIGVIRKVSSFSPKKCTGGCKDCAASYRGCIPQNAQSNMGEIWEVVRN